jgi:hypothetical protein
LKASRDGVHLIPLSYDEYVRALELADSQRLIATELDEFRTFLDQQSLLPTWRGLLDVVNCRQSMNEVEEGCYMCPDTGGPYSHRRARFFGPYANKRVQAVFQIDAVVSVDREFNARTQYRNSAEPEADLNKRAIAEVRKWRSDEVEKHSMQVFLLSNKAQTRFTKDTPGGMQSSKIYFSGFSECEASAEVARLLNDKTWSKWSSEGASG